MGKTDPDKYSEVFEYYTTKQLLKIQRKINKEILRRLQLEEDR